MLERGNNRLIIASDQSHYYDESYVQRMLNFIVPPWNVQFCQIIWYLNNYSISQSFLPSFDPLLVLNHVTDKVLGEKCLIITKIASIKRKTTVKGHKVTPESFS